MTQPVVRLASFFAGGHRDAGNLEWVCLLMPFRTIGTHLRKLRKWRSYVLIVALAYILTLAFGTLLAPFRTNLENLVFDQYQRWKPRPYDFDQPVRIVDIDDKSIHLIGRWPWPRQTMASLVEALAKANVAAVGFDVLFSEKDRPSEDLKACAQGAHRADEESHCEERADGDLAFAHAITDRPVVLGLFLTPTHNGSQASLTTKGGFSFIGDPPTSSSKTSAACWCRSQSLPTPRRDWVSSTGSPTTTGSSEMCRFCST